MAKYGSLKYGSGVKYGLSPITGIIGAILPISTGNVAGTVKVKGTLNTSLASLTATTAGQTKIRGTAAGQLASLATTITGKLSDLYAILTPSRAYLTEEARLRGAIPQVRAVINPPGGLPVEIPASKIIKAGNLTASAPPFQVVTQNAHQLTVDNRDGALNPGTPGCPLQPGQWFNTKLQIDFGFKTATGIEWLTFYTGLINGLTGLDHAFGKGHNATITSASPISFGLNKKIGCPAADGTRQPFMSGFYLANAELKQTIEPELGAIAKNGTGTATLVVIGAENFTSQEDLSFRVQIDSNGGEIGTATFKWSTDRGQSWEKSGVYTTNITAPITLSNQIKVYWISGPGSDFIINDYWDFTVTARTYQFFIPGAPFLAITHVYQNASLVTDGLTVDAATGLITVSGTSGRIRARVRKDLNSHPVDIIKSILTEVGLGSYINEASFADARDQTNFYNIGIRFENVTAAKAIQTIIATMLYVFWIGENNQVFLQAWTPTPEQVVWARSSQFNWLWDNMGGSSAYQPVCGQLQNATATVEADGTVLIRDPLPGAGKCAFVRGVWKTSAVFTYNGFWANAESGDLTNYYSGGSFVNAGMTTTVTLGSALAPGTQVQLFYFYDLETPTVQYEAMNNSPCPRKAFRAVDDFNYDYAPDRIMDLIRILHTAQLVRGTDYSGHIAYLWEKFYQFSYSRTSPLLFDNYERSLWDRGPYPIYKDSTVGQTGFETFDIQLYPGDEDNFVNLENPRALQVVLPGYSTSRFSAWWGYGLNWKLDYDPFTTVDTLSLKLRSARRPCNIANLVRLGYAGGNASLIVQCQDAPASTFSYVIYILTGGAIGTATFIWSKDSGATWENLTTPMVTGDKDHPTHLNDNLWIWWESNGGTDFVAPSSDPSAGTNDCWAFLSLETFTYPQRLLLCLNDSTLADPDPWTPAHTFVHALPDNYEILTALAIPLTEFWRTDNLVFDNDRQRGSGWASWYSASGYEPASITIYERETPETIEGYTFYSQLRIDITPGPTTTAWGVWTGLDTSKTNSTGYGNINAAVFPVGAGANFTMRLKIKDAHGSYFHKDFTVIRNTWNRLSVNFADMVLESGSLPLTHPLQLVDIGVPAAPADISVYLTDMKFGDHLTFAGPSLRLLEFKYFESNLALDPPAWWVDDLSLNLTADDPYPYTPHLSMSIGPSGQIFYRGPTLVHYADPLAPYLAGEPAIEATNVRFHADAQDLYHANYGGTKGPIMPVHTRNDIENVADLGYAKFHRFCWWPDYPEVNLDLGQYWAFMRLASYYFFTGNTDAWAVLDNWLTWFDAQGIADGPGWNFPHLFSDTGFSISGYDAGATSPIAIGCLYIYMKNQDARASTWARRILDDLRLNRQSPDYPYLYKSDFHHVWMQALVAHAFGMAATGRPGSSYTFATIPEDRTHFESMVAQFMAMAGNSKPNVLNADLIPFSNVENNDSWEYAPAYMTNKEAGSIEALVMMLDVAQDYAWLQNDWTWFDTLVAFVLNDRLATLEPHNIQGVTTNLQTAQVANIVRVIFGDFMTDKDYYREARNDTIIEQIGEMPQEIDLRYGNPVITEDAATAQDLADRTLDYSLRPKETATVQTWMEGARIRVGDIVPVTSDFHNLDHAHFLCTGRGISLDQKRVTLTAARYKDLT